MASGASQVSAVWPVTVTPTEGKLISAAFLDAFNKLVGQVNAIRGK
ncbi:MAG: hypothetical protein ACREYE_21610 [Gammaproteobacteria bacterium]